jgi:hypothetical protein
MLSDMATALVPITATAWKAAQHFSYGARGFMRVPVSEANDLNYLLCFILITALKPFHSVEQCAVIAF